MIRYVFIFFVAITLPVMAQQKNLRFDAHDRIVIVAPHPDDDILGAGGAIQQALAAGADVRVIYLTNGDHNQIAFKLFKHRLHLSAKTYVALGEQRHNEAIAATSVLGLPADNLTFLGYPDWGTLAMWRDYWEEGELFRSDATRATAVPYPDALGYGRPYKPQSVVTDFAALFRKFRPTKIFVTHPADTNPDHRAAANFVRLATLDVEDDGLRPQIYYYVIHFGRWPRPYHYHPDIEMEPPRALLDDGVWMTLGLSPSETETKYQAILQHRTQITTRQYFLVSFARSNEVFATIVNEAVPNVPTGLAVDWRKAVRAKAIACPPGEPGETMGEHTQTNQTEQSIAIDHVDFLRQGNDLIAQVELRNRLGRRSGVHLFLFGYKRGTDFAALPKVDVNVGPFGGLFVYVGGRRVMTHDVKIVSVGQRFFVRIPLRLLGGDDLDHLFTCTRAHLGEIAADDTAWQLFELQSDHQQATKQGSS